jgi:MoaA/NifB/PqqE/SkfB family radical SAM enzyme
VIEACKDIAPVSLMFTLSPYNHFSDMDYVVEIAKKYDIDVRIGIYNNIDFFETKDKAHEMENAESKDNTSSDFKRMIPANVAGTSENYDFLLLYDEWRKGNVKLKCHSIRDSLVIHPNGDVPICQNLDVKLGNVYENSLDEIFNSPSTLKLHKQYGNNCNGCWINFHRKYDIVLLRVLENFLPKRLIEIFFYGKYQWTNNRKTTYKQFLQQCEGE